MNTQYTIRPVLRLLLTLIGSTGIFSLMFFDNAQPITNILALAGIIPIILGLTGDNLFYSLLAKRIMLNTPAPTPSPSSNSPDSAKTIPLSTTGNLFDA